MKLWIHPRNLPGNSNPNRTAPSRPLHRRYHSSLLIRSQHMPKRTVWVTNPQPTCKRSLPLLYLHLPPHRPRLLLWFIPLQGNLKHRNYPPTNPDSNSLRWLCPTLRPDIILRCHSHYKPILRNPLHWTDPSRVSLRRILSRQPNPNPILHPTLSPPIYNHQLSPHPPNLST